MERLQLKRFIKKDKLHVKVIPNSSKNEILGIENNILKVRIKATPDKDKANNELLKFLKKEFNFNALIIKGQKSREKILLIQLP